MMTRSLCARHGAAGQQVKLGTEVGTLPWEPIGRSSGQGQGWGHRLLSHLGTLDLGFSATWKRAPQFLSFSPWERIRNEQTGAVWQGSPKHRHRPGQVPCRDLAKRSEPFSVVRALAWTSWAIISTSLPVGPWARSKVSKTQFSQL